MIKKKIGSELSNYLDAKVSIFSQLMCDSGGTHLGHALSGVSCQIQNTRERGVMDFCRGRRIGTLPKTMRIGLPSTVFSTNSLALRTAPSSNGSSPMLSIAYPYSPRCLAVCLRSAARARIADALKVKLCK